MKEVSAEVQYLRHVNLKSLITIQDTFNGLTTDSRAVLFITPMQFTKQMKDILQATDPTIGQILLFLPLFLVMLYCL